MNGNKPVQLSQKIDYLQQKISKIHTQIRKNDDLQLRLNFQEYIDSCIRQIIAIRDTSTPKGSKKNQYNTGNTSQYQGQAYGTGTGIGTGTSPSNYQSLNPNDSRSKIYTVQADKLQVQRKIVQLQMKQLEVRQVQMEQQTARIRIQKNQQQIQRLQQQKIDMKRRNAQQIKRVAERTKFVEQQVEKLVKLNKAQQQQMRKLRQQRNRAQAIQLEIQKKYDEEIGKLQKFNQKNPRYLDRNTDGLKCTRYYTNTAPAPTSSSLSSQSQSPSSSQRLVILKLPITLQVHKLVYGILLGVQVSNKQILYYDKFQLYEKEPVKIQQEYGQQKEGGGLVLTYGNRKRKGETRVVLDRYVVRNGEIVVMLYGRGDSIIVHEESK